MEKVTYLHRNQSAAIAAEKQCLSSRTLLPVTYKTVMLEVADLLRFHQQRIINGESRERIAESLAAIEGFLRANAKR